MGVMACTRNDCENVMCNRYSSKFGYICNECFEELVKVYPFITITDFMNTPKGKENIEPPDYRESLNDVFKLTI